MAWAFFYIVAFGSALFSISWSFGDTVPLMQKAARLEWREAIVDAFARGVEYRPFFMLSIKAFLDAFGTPVWLYQSLVLLQFGAVLSLVVWLCLPLGIHRALAACLAVSVLCALHTTRILFGFWPLNQHSGVLVLVLLTIALAFREQTRRFDWTLGVIALAAMFGLELGLLLVPVIVIASSGPLFEKTVSNMQEVRARGGKIVLISDAEGIAAAGEGCMATIEMPVVHPLIAPLVYAVPVQLLAYHVAVAKGTDVDQPRNLAKSVTVE